MKAKKLLALVLTGAMALGSSFTVLADEPEGVSGQGAVEYDNSEAIEYDKVTVPTLTPATYNMTIDTNGLLKEYDPVTYSADKTVYFYKTITPATLDVDATLEKVGAGNKLYYKYQTKVGNEFDLKSIFTAAAGEVTGVESGYYVWTPVTAADQTVTVGKLGEYTALTLENYSKYIVVEAEETAINSATIRPTFKAGADVFDGEIYTDAYEEIDEDFDVKGTDHYSVTLNASGDEAASVTGLYTSADGNAYATLGATDAVILPAEIGYTDTTDAVKVTNKSTKDKTVKAVVKLVNPEGLTIKDSADFDEDTDASIYVAATNGTDTQALAKNGTAVSATYEVTLPAATKTEITYQLGTMNTLGSHNYARYEAPGVIYSSDSFYITAAANASDDAQDAWAEYVKNATAAPNLNIVYTVTDSASAILATADVTKISMSKKTVNITNGTFVSATFTKPDGVTTVDIADTQYTLSNEGATVEFGSFVKDANAGGKVTITFSDGGTAVINIVTDANNP